MVLRLPLVLQLLLLVIVEGANQNEVYFVVKEESPKSTVIGDLVAAFGLKEKYNAASLRSFRFRFLNQPQCDIIIEETSGVLRTNGRIDRETLCRNEELCVVRFDVAVQPMHFFQIIKVVVEILDVNDNRPQFETDRKTYEIPESTPLGSSISIPSAVDNDTADFSIAKYSMQFSDVLPYFELKVSKKRDGSTDLKLILVKELDREVQDAHNLKVLAIDGGTPARSGFVDITITVLDANDNVPVFEKNTYEISIAENLPPLTTILRVKADDLDCGPNAEIRYSFTHSTSLTCGDVFSVNNSTGDIIVTGDVDFETSPEFRIIVCAQNPGEASMSSEAMVIIKVEDENDNHPAVTINALSASATSVTSVLEDVGIGTFVAHVIVTDDDAGLNGLCNCSLSVVVDEFRLLEMFPMEYQLVTAASLDRETTPIHVIVIVCEDGGKPRLASQTTLQVDINDVNDNAPHFQPTSFVANVLENNYIGASVVAVGAVDEDAGVNCRLTYLIQFSADSHYFDIDSEVGLVTAKHSFDHEKFTQLSFTVLAVDHGIPSRTGSAVVVVNIQDVNDESPRFLSSVYSLGLEENRPSGYEVGILSASDADEYPFNSFSFSLMPSGSLSDAFVIDARSGRITTTRPLDREDQEYFYMTALVSDASAQSLSNTAGVTIYVMDVNDNQPSFVVSGVKNVTNVATRISCQARIGTVIMQVSAVDEDAGENGQVVYRADVSAREILSIHPFFGTIILSTDLTLISGDNTTLAFVITATDRGNPPLSSQMTLTIFVDTDLDFPKDPTTILDQSMYNKKTIILSLSVLVSALIVVFIAVLICFCNMKRRHESKNLEAVKATRIYNVARKQDNEVMSESSSTVYSGMYFGCKQIDAMYGCTKTTKNVSFADNGRLSPSKSQSPLTTEINIFESVRLKL